MENYLKKRDLKILRKIWFVQLLILFVAVLEVNFTQSYVATSVTGVIVDFLSAGIMFLAITSVFGAVLISVKMLYSRDVKEAAIVLVNQNNAEKYLWRLGVIGLSELFIGVITIYLYLVSDSDSFQIDSYMYSFILLIMCSVCFVVICTNAIISIQLFRNRNNYLNFFSYAVLTFIILNVEQIFSSVYSYNQDINLTKFILLMTCYIIVMLISIYEVFSLLKNRIEV